MPTKRMSIWLKLIIGLAAACALFLGVCYVVLSGDETPPDVSDLLLEHRDIPTEENAYAQLTLLAAETSDPYAAIDTEIYAKLQSMSSGETEWDDVLVSEILANTDDLWPAIRRILEAPESQSPTINAYSDLLPEVSPMRNVFRLASLKATQLGVNGNSSESAALIGDIMLLGQRVENSRGCLITWLTGCAGRSFGYQAIKDIEQNKGFDNSTRLRLIALLDSARPAPSGLDDAFKNEFRVFSNEWQRLHEQTHKDRLSALKSLNVPPGFRYGSWLPLTFKLNKTRRLHADYLRKMMAYNADRDIKTMIQSNESGRFFAEVKGKLYNPENIIGRIFSTITIPTYQALITTRYNSESTISATQALLAVRAYQHDHDGALPETLDILVPRYLPAVPLDYYDREPIRYSPEFRAIWSLGRKGEYTVASADQPADEGEVDLRIP